MGLFDSIRCEYPLPGMTLAEQAAQNFQTKDLDCQMDHYLITADGRLEGVYPDFTGEIEFYSSNVVASGPGIYTRNGEDAWFLEFKAIFVGGKITSVETIENRKERAAKNNPRAYPSRSKEEIRASREYEKASRIGQRLFLWWGGGGEGYFVTVIAENDREFVCQKEDGGEFEKVSRSHLNRCLWEKQEDSVRYRKERDDLWERERQDYEREISMPRETAVSK